jgi:membrane-associated phospholipid phosphatase
VLPFSQEGQNPYSKTAPLSRPLVARSRSRQCTYAVRTAIDGPNSMSWMHLISDFGDSGVLLPLSLILTVALWRYQSSRAAVYFLSAAGFCLTVIVSLKLILIACGNAWGGGIVSPSGHTSMSATVYGVVGLVTARQAPYWQRPLIAFAMVAFVCCIALSRIVLGAHSIAEVVLGFLVGTAAVYLFARQYFRLGTRKINLLLVGTSFVLVLLLLHGTRLPVEEFIRQLAAVGRTNLHACPGEQER